MVTNGQQNRLALEKCTDSFLFISGFSNFIEVKFLSEIMLV